MCVGTNVRHIFVVNRSSCVGSCNLKHYWLIFSTQIQLKKPSKAVNVNINRYENNLKLFYCILLSLCFAPYSKSFHARCDYRSTYRGESFSLLAASMVVGLWLKDHFSIYHDLKDNRPGFLDHFYRVIL